MSMTSKMFLSFWLLGIKSAESLRDNLKKAIRQKDMESLQSAIDKGISSGYASLESDIQQARDILELMKSGRGGLIPGSLTIYFTLSQKPYNYAHSYKSIRTLFILHMNTHYKIYIPC